MASNLSQLERNLSATPETEFMDLSFDDDEEDSSTRNQVFVLRKRNTTIYPFDYTYKVSKWDLSCFFELVHVSTICNIDDVFCPAFIVPGKWTEYSVVNLFPPDLWNTIRIDFSLSPCAIPLANFQLWRLLYFRCRNPCGVIILIRACKARRRPFLVVEKCFHLSIPRAIITIL